jgi:hypothetical protein
MESLCFTFEFLSFSGKRKRTFQYEDEGIRHRNSKRIRLMKFSDSGVGLQFSREKVPVERSDQPLKVDAGVSRLVKDARRVDKVDKLRQNRRPINRDSKFDLKKKKPNVTKVNWPELKVKPIVAAGDGKDLRYFLDSKRERTVKATRVVTTSPTFSEQKPSVHRRTITSRRRLVRFE